MRQVRWASLMVGTAMLAVLGVRPAVADVRSDQAAAILEWPNILFFEADHLPSFLNVIDTIVQLSNTSSEPVVAWCFYENANAHCTNTGFVCLAAEECCDMTLGCGLCRPDWNETDFRVRLTPRQPLGWLASQGLSGFDPFPPKTFGTFPIDGVTNCGLAGGSPGTPGPTCTSSNVGSAIPPVPESPFNGSLRCIAVDDDNIPVDRNVLKGEQTIGVLANDFDVIQVAKDNAIGIQAIPGAVNDDNILVLGGDGAEYNGCPNILILNHFFDFALNPAVPPDYPTGPYPIFTVLTLVPCSQDFLRQIPGAAVVQYLIFNEFEQRFSTSKPFNCKFISQISNIDTTQNERSVFSAGVAGTLTGQTRINAIGSGVLGDAIEIHDVAAIDSFNLHYQGDRTDSDLIILP